MEKKMFSINLAATVMVLTHLMPEIKLDEATGSYYAVFPQCQGVEAAIHSFRTDSRLEINLRQFLEAIKYIRTAMALKGTGGERGGKR